MMTIMIGEHLTYQTKRLGNHEMKPKTTDCFNINFFKSCVLSKYFICNIILFNFRDPDLLTVPHWQSPTREQHRVSWAQTSRHSSIPCDNSATKGIDLFRHRSSSFASLSIMNGYKLL